MEIIGLVGKYVELSIQKEYLEYALWCESNYEDYASKKSEMAFNANDLNREKSYNNSLQKHKENAARYEKELRVVTDNIDIVHREYVKTTNEASLEELRKTLSDVQNKIVAMEEFLEVTKAKRDAAIRHGNEAFDKGDYYKEKDYNQEAYDCYERIVDLEAKIRHYTFVFNDLEFVFYGKQGRNL